MGCQDDSDEWSTYSIRSEDDVLIDAINQVGFSFISKFALSETSYNYIPINQFQLLGMLMNGAAPNWPNITNEHFNLNNMSQDEINNSMKRILESLRSDEIGLSTSCWYKDNITLTEGFTERACFFFDTDFIASPFSQNLAQDIRNHYSATDETIDKISIEDYTEKKTCVLVSNFSATLAPNDNYHTDSLLFYSPAGTKKIKSITIDCQGKYLSGNTLTFIEIPTNNSTTAIDLLIPVNGENTNETLANFTPELWADLRRESQTTEFKIRMPAIYEDCFCSAQQTLANSKIENLSEAAPVLDTSTIALLSRVNLKIPKTNNTSGHTKSKTDVIEISANTPFSYILYEKKSGCILAIGTFFAK